MRAAVYLAIIIFLLVILVFIAGIATTNAPKGEGVWYANMMLYCIVGGGALLLNAFISMQDPKFMTHGKFDPKIWC